MRPYRASGSLSLVALVATLTACSGNASSNVIPSSRSAPQLSTVSQAAPVTSVTCTQRNLSGPDGVGVWPYSTNVVGCTGTSSLRTVQAALQQIVDKYFVDGPKLQNLAPPVWIFHTVADYKTVWQGAANVPLPTNVFGVTYVQNVRPGGPNKGKPYTLIFEQSNGLADVYIGHTASHEMGHWIDRFIEGTVANPYSAQDLWTIELSADWTHFNGLAGQCSLPNQVFNGERPSPALPTTATICTNNGQGPDLSSRFAGLSNTGVLQKAWSAIFAAPLSHYERDIFAEETAVDGGLQWPDLDTYFERNEWWTCTQTLLKSQLTYGAPPGHLGSPYTWPAGCPKM